MTVAVAASSFIEVSFTANLTQLSTKMHSIVTSAFWHVELWISSQLSITVDAHFSCLCFGNTELLLSLLFTLQTKVTEQSSPTWSVRNSLKWGPVVNRDSQVEKKGEWSPKHLCGSYKRRLESLQILTMYSLHHQSIQFF